MAVKVAMKAIHRGRADAAADGIRTTTIVASSAEGCTGTAKDASRAGTMMMMTGTIAISRAIGATAATVMSGTTAMTVGTVPLAAKADVPCLAVMEATVTDAAGSAIRAVILKRRVAGGKTATTAG